MECKEKWEIADVITRKLVGNTLTEREQMFFNAWIKESPEHRSLYQKMADGQTAAHYAKSMAKIDISQGIASVHQKGSKRKRMRGFRWLSGAAAAVILSFILPYAIDFSVNRNKMSLLDIAPAGFAAELILEDGSRIALDRTTPHLGRKELLVDTVANRVIYAQEEAAASLVFNTLEVPSGAEYNLQLADGTLIHLNPATTIRFPKAFYGDTREVWLWGEAYFEVAPSSKPFMVHSGEMTVSVVGTSFNVMAYHDYSVFETTLTTGSVKVQLGNDADKAVVLSPGTQARLNLSDGQIAVRKVDTAKYTAWKARELIFDHETFGEIALTLSRWYKVDIVIESDELSSVIFYGKLPRYEHIATIFDLMQKVHKFHVETTDGKITLKEVLTQ